MFRPGLTMETAENEDSYFLLTGKYYSREHCCANSRNVILKNGPWKVLFIILSSRGLGIHVLVNGFTSYEHWENRCTSSLVKSNACIFSISLIVLGWCWFFYFISDYSRIGSSQSLWVSQMQDPDVQPLEWISPAVAAGYHFLFSVFLSRCDCTVHHQHYSFSHHFLVTMGN